jgi:hypothetical protein
VATEKRAELLLTTLNDRIMQHPEETFVVDIRAILVLFDFSAY